MTTKVNKTIMVNVPISTAYRQWTTVRGLSALHGRGRTRDAAQRRPAGVGGRNRRRPSRWEAKIVQQDLDRAVAWAAVEGAKNAGWVEFKEAGPSQTSLHLSLEYEPHGVLEFLGDKLHIVERQAESDLKKFKEYIEKQTPETGRHCRDHRGTGGGVGNNGHVGNSAHRVSADHRSCHPRLRPNQRAWWTSRAIPTKPQTATPAVRPNGRKTRTAGRASSRRWVACQDSGSVRQAKRRVPPGSR